ncbi:MAG: hypothetical protein ACFCU7_14015 [Pleurocapsa sp.]
MSINKQVTAKDPGWTNQKLINMSQNLGQGYCPGLNNDQSQPKADSWNAQKYINMSRSLSSAYGIDF